MVVRVASVWYLYGVTSFGEGCADPGAHGVYIRITAMLEYILQTTNQHNDGTAVVADVLDSVYENSEVCLDDSGVFTDTSGSDTER